MTQPMTNAVLADVARSRAHAEQILGDLGFAAPADVEEAVVNEHDPRKGVFRKAKLGLVVADRVRVVRRDTVLVEAPPVDGHIERAFWVPSSRLVVLYDGRSEGCEGTDPQGITVIRVP